MKKTLALVLFILAGGILFFLKEHYRQKKTEETPLTLTWTMSPVVITDLSKPVLFRFHLSEEDAAIDLMANMSHPGMVPVTARVDNLGKGDYSSQFLLTMHGDWIVFLTIKLKNGVAVKKEILFKTAQ